VIIATAKQEGGKMSGSRSTKNKRMKKEINTEKMSIKNYIFCKDCNEYQDFWKYDSIEDTGHSGHNWRYVTKKELKWCVESCRKDGCFDECIIGITIINPGILKTKCAICGNELTYKGDYITRGEMCGHPFDYDKVKTKIKKDKVKAV
jgi:hypothetical protein